MIMFCMPAVNLGLSGKFNIYCIDLPAFIFRMCDSDAELKGSAEKGLMQAIIGPTMPNHRSLFHYFLHGR